MNKNILNALRMQPLSDEEKSKRHILGRLAGPIATCVEGTRNGRRYNRELWEKALADDLTKEKVENKSLFLELGHPVDREETCMEKVCACIPEMPKIIGDELYAYVDILDTPNGKLLKTLCDYGFVPGISSRGSGDVMSNGDVDPETFFLETWDIVQLPAVKTARLTVCESLDGKNAKLQKALTESYNSADEKEKKIMKESLEQLDISLTEDAGTFEYGTPKDDALIPESNGENGDLDDGALFEGADDEEPESETPEAKEPEGDEEKEPVDPEAEEPKEGEENEDEGDEEGLKTVKDLVDMINGFDGDLEIEFQPLTIGDTEVKVNGITLDEVDDKLLVGVDYDYDPETDGDKEEDDEAPAEVAEPEEDGESEEAADGGIEEVLGSLKEAIRRKSELEDELKAAKAGKTVSDAKVKTLEEELAKYKTSFARTSEIAAKVGKLEGEVKSLNEQIQTKNDTIVKLKAKAADTAKLNESVNASVRQAKALKEQLKSARAEVADLDAQLAANKTESAKKLAESAKIANAYKAKFKLVLNRYVESKASMLGVKPTDITGRLNESYTLDDIDRVCDELLDYNSNFGRLPFGAKGSAKVKITESVDTTRKRQQDPEYGYEIDDDLLRLAGLKD